jgi:hypothetical protein
MRLHFMIPASHRSGTVSWRRYLSSAQLADAPTSLERGSRLAGGRTLMHDEGTRSTLARKILSSGAFLTPPPWRQNVAHLLCEDDSKLLFMYRGPEVSFLRSQRFVTTAGDSWSLRH